MERNHLNTAMGLQMVGENKSLYQRFIKSFVAANQSEIGDLERLLAHDTERFKRVVHTIKGQAGSIGATDLKDLAKKLEEEPCQLNLELFTQEFHGVTKEIEHILNAEVSSIKIRPVEFKEKLLISKEELDQLFEELERALDHNRPLIVEDRIAEIRRYQLSTRDEVLLHEMQNLINTYQLKNALKVLQIRKSNYY